MKQNDVETYVKLKFLPVKVTDEYVESLPIEVKEKIVQRVDNALRNPSKENNEKLKQFLMYAVTNSCSILTAYLLECLIAHYSKEDA